MKKNRNILVEIIFIIILVFSAFRVGIGTDYFTYEEFYENPHLISTEIGFRYLILFFKWFNNNPRFFFIITSILILIPFYLAIKQKSRYPVLSTLLFVFIFYFISLNIVRQFIIITFFYFICIDLILKNQYKQYILVILLLSSIHISAIALLPVFLFVKKDLRFVSYIIVWIISIFFATQYFSFFKFINQFSVQFQLENSSNIKISAYAQNIENLLIEEKTYNKLMLLNLIFGIIVFKYKYLKTKQYQLIWFNLFFLSVVLRNLLNQMISFHRIALYFEVSIIFLIPIIISIQKKEIKRKIIYIASVMLFGVLCYYRFVLNHEAGIYLF